MMAILLGPRPARVHAGRHVVWMTVGLALAGCGGGGESSEPTFKPLSYSYLTPLRLNVGQIQIQDDVPPPANPSDLGASAPVPPDQALKQMAQDRLVAAGNSGTAVFTIDQAGITGQAGGTLDGTMAVHLDIVSNSGGHAGYAEAHVSREFVPGSGSDNEGLKSQLYGLTRQMMQDMNIELEFQLRRTLGDWMLDASGAPVAGGVEQQPLSGPGAGPAAGGAAMAPSPADVGAPTQLAPPASAVPPGAVSVTPPPPDAAVNPTASPPQALSPPPGVLQAPPGAVPVAVPVEGPVVPSGAPVPLAPAAVPVAVPAGAPVPLAPVAVAAPAAVPTTSPALPAAAQAYHGHYPTPPGYHPSAATSDGTATPGGY